MNVYDFEAERRNGEVISLGEYEGKVLLIINSATECGFTPQYDGLQDMFEKYVNKDFMILDFPCNQFGNQAPGSNDEIATFCDSKFGIKFPIFSKVDVNGENAIPLYQFLVSEKGFEGFDENHPITPLLDSMLSKTNPDYKNDPSIKWNFTKFLIDRQGNVVERFEPTVDIAIVEDRVREIL